MKQIHIIYYHYLREDAATLSVGGVQTYLYHLCKVIQELDMQPVIYQMARQAFDTEYQGIQVRGLAVSKKDFSRKALGMISDGQAVIFGTDDLIRPYHGTSLAIQHGISWDRPKHQGKGKLFNSLYIYHRATQAHKMMRNLRMVDKTVCVDYNFINWYRTQLAYPETELVCIPNFAQIPPQPEKPADSVNIMFARRFFAYRGTRIFTGAIKKLLGQFPQVYVTVAGEGPDEAWLREQLGNLERVQITKYESSESAAIHADKHIAVVPTLGSEGTSLSLLEAMASRCAVICTNVGGMTNIVIDRFNGLMINPDEDSLYRALVTLVEDQSLRQVLANRAYETVFQGFSFDLWKERWIDVLHQLDMKER